MANEAADGTRDNARPTARSDACTKRISAKRCRFHPRASTRAKVGPALSRSRRCSHARCPRAPASRRLGARACPRLQLAGWGHRRPREELLAAARRQSGQARAALRHRLRAPLRHPRAQAPPGDEHWRGLRQGSRADPAWPAGGSRQLTRCAVPQGHRRAVTAGARAAARETRSRAPSYSVAGAGHDSRRRHFGSERRDIARGC
jgi:hypothetical protein